MAKALTPEEKAAKKAAKATNLGDATVVAVEKGGEVIREYSEEIHGEGFADLATEFASKEEGRTVVPKE